MLEDGTNPEGVQPDPPLGWDTSLFQSGSTTPVVVYGNANR